MAFVPSVFDLFGSSLTNYYGSAEHYVKVFSDSTFSLVDFVEGHGSLIEYPPTVVHLVEDGIISLFRCFPGTRMVAVNAGQFGYVNFLFQSPSQVRVNGVDYSVSNKDGLRFMLDEEGRTYRFYVMVPKQQTGFAVRCVNRY